MEGKQVSRFVPQYRGDVEEWGRNLSTFLSSELGNIYGQLNKSINQDPEYDKTLYPEMYGAAGDGIYDDTDGIIAAINAASAGYKIVLQSDRYKISRGLVLSTDKIRLEGASGMVEITTAADIDGITISSLLASVRNIYIHNTGGASTRAGIKLIDGAKDCSFYDLLSIGFKYGYELSSSTAVGVAYNNFYACRAQYATSYEVYIHHTGAPAWVNENNFFGCSYQSLISDHLIYCPSDTNNNKFIGCNIEGGVVGRFAIHDCGVNHYISCRCELAGWGLYAENGAGNWSMVLSVETCHWQGPYPKIAVDGTAGLSKVHINNEGTFIGGLCAGERVATTVDANSLLGQRVLNVTATTSFYVDDVILINSGGARQEWSQVESIQAGVSLTLTNDLIYTHTAAQGDTVAQRGLKNGISYRAWNLFDFYTYGMMVMQIDYAGNLKTIGTMTASTTLTP